MFNCPYFQPKVDLDNEYLFRQDGRTSYVRILHASPDSPRVDVYVNENLIAGNLSYRNFTDYIRLEPGLYDIRVYVAGTKANPLINTRIPVPANSIYTIAAIDTLKNISLLPILEPTISYAPGTSMIRFIHLSPDTPAVDITLPNGQKLFKDVEYKEVTGYIPVTPGTYTIQARPTGSDSIALIVPNIKLQPNKIYSIYAIGLSKGNPPLQVLIPLDGSTYLRF